VLAAPPANAAISEQAHQLTGLFLQSCLVFAGDAPGLRGWARQTGLTELPEPARTAFLHGAQGVVFDASNSSGKFVLVSADGGSCSALTNAADAAAVIGGLETDLARAGIQLRLLNERGDPQEKTLHYREYAAARNGRTWRILAGTVKDRQGGQAMLTANPG
jgi:hypothetical protein